MAHGHGGGGPKGEDEILGKAYDARLVKRLLVMLRPYWGLIALAVLVLILVTSFNLVLPFFTKLIIDRHINVTGRKAVLAQPFDGAIPLAGDTVLIVASRLSNEQRLRYRDIEKSGQVLGMSYYCVDVEALPRNYFTALVERVTPWPFLRAPGQKLSAPLLRSDQEFHAANRPLIDTLVQRHPGLFTRYGTLRLVPFAELNRLTPRESAALRGADIRGITQIGVLFLCLLVLNFILNYSQTILIQLVGQRFMHGMRRAIFAKLQRQDMAYFDRNPVGRLVTRVTNDVDAVNEAFVSVFASMIRNVIMVLALMVVMLLSNVRLSLVAFSVLPFLIFWAVLFRIRGRSLYRRYRVRLARLNAFLSENFSGVRMIAVFQRQRENVRRFNAINDDFFQVALQEMQMMASMRPIFEVISSIGLALILYYGGGQVVRAAVSLGTLVAFITYMRMFFNPVQELTEVYTTLQSAMASSERIFQLMDEPVRIASPARPVPLAATKGRIEFRNVNFEYLPGEPVLKDVSFTVEPGERVAFVGATGSGKTTIINLIARLYDIQQGEILMDGADIRKMDLHQLRSKLGVVMQDVFLFAGDIKGNIRLNRSLTDAQVAGIAREVHADTFIERFPKGYDEEVRERGVTLSAGERQLLSFARAMAFDPPILVLDEATANIDSGTEKLIQDALAKLMKGRTSIVIAHRLSTIKNVDRIYVIHKGEIKEQGTHQSLLRQQGLYYKLYQLQHGGEDPAAS